jgi:rhodanese-related sulfurtransferase
MVGSLSQAPSDCKHTCLGTCTCTRPAILPRPKTPEVFSRMQRLLEFIGHHPYLASGAVLAAVALAVYEVQARLQAFAALSAMQAVRLMNQGALVLDLRTKESFEAGHIGDARNVPASDLESQADSLKKWRDKNIIAYDDGGNGGAGAARALTKLGFTKVFSLEGGLNAWVKDNLPLTKTTSGGKASAK